MSGLPARIVAALIAGLLVFAAAPAGAHESIAGSDPASGSTLDEPISQVTIDFGEPITENVQMAISLDRGDGTFEDMDGTTTRIDEQTAQLEFDELTTTGRYFVRYIATIASDGHVPAGAIFFDYGEAASSGTNWWIWIAFGIFAVVVLAAAVWIGLRPRRAEQAADDTAAAV